MLGRLPQIAAPAAQATAHAVRRVGRQGTPNERAALARALRAGVSKGLIRADDARSALASGNLHAVATLAAEAAQRAGSQFRGLPAVEAGYGLGEHRVQMLAQGQCERGAAVRWLREAARLGLVGGDTIRAALRRGDARLAWLAQACAQRLTHLMTQDTQRTAPASTDAPGGAVSLEQDGWVVHSMLPLHVVELSGLADCPDHLARAVRTAVDALSIHGLPFRSFMEWEYTIDDDMLCWDAAEAMDELEAEKGRGLERADFEVVAEWIGIDPDCLNDLYRIRSEGYGLPEQLIDPSKPVCEITPLLRGAAAAYPQSAWSAWLGRMVQALEWFERIDLPEIDSCNGESVDLLARCVAPGLWRDIECMQLESFNELLMQTGDAGLVVSPSLEALRNLLTAIAWVVGLLDEAASIDIQQRANEEVHREHTERIAA